MNRTPLLGLEDLTYAKHFHRMKYGYEPTEVFLNEDDWCDARGQLYYFNGQAMADAMLVYRVFTNNRSFVQ